MKALIFVTTLVLSISLQAQSISGTNGGGTLSNRGGTDAGGTIFRLVRNGSGGNAGGKVINLNEADVEAIITKDDVYVRPNDLRDGIEQVEGVQVIQNVIQFDFNRVNLNLDHIIMNSGKVLKVSGEGGNMGGG